MCDMCDMHLASPPAPVTSFLTKKVVNQFAPQDAGRRQGVGKELRPPPPGWHSRTPSGRCGVVVESNSEVGTPWQGQPCPGEKWVPWYQRYPHAAFWEVVFEQS